MTESWTFHGGRLAEARAAFGDGGAPWLDLSTGINPHGWPGVNALAIDWRRLPDDCALRALEAAAAAHFGADPACVVALPGTEIGLRLLGTILPGPTHHVWPSYRTHAEMAPGSVAISRKDIPHISGNIILANPNNPDGHLLSKAALLGLLARQQDAGGWLVVDEAFADAHPHKSIAADVGQKVPLIVFRSFGKFFGLAGLRLGFMIGPPPIVAQLRALIGAWPVSAAAIAIGTAAYRDGSWIAAMRERLMTEAAMLDATLARHGLTAAGACPLFRLVTVADATALFRRLAVRAILTRPFDHDPRWLRIGLPDGEEALARLDQALADG